MIKYKVSLKIVTRFQRRINGFSTHFQVHPLQNALLQSAYVLKIVTMIETRRVGVYKIVCGRYGVQSIDSF